MCCYYALQRLVSDNAHAHAAAACCQIVNVSVNSLPTIAAGQRYDCVFRDPVTGDRATTDGSASTGKVVCPTPFQPPSLQPEGEGTHVM